MFNNSRDAYAIGAFKSGSSVNPQTTEEVDAVVDELKARSLWCRPMSWTRSSIR